MPKKVKTLVDEALEFLWLKQPFLMVFLRYRILMGRIELLWGEIRWHRFNVANAKQESIITENLKG